MFIDVLPEPMDPFDIREGDENLEDRNLWGATAFLEWRHSLEVREELSSPKEEDFFPFRYIDIMNI